MSTRVSNPAHLRERLAWLLPLGILAAIVISRAAARPEPSRITLPLEILGEDGATVDAAFALSAAQAQSAQTLWLQIHGLRYADEAGLQINSAEWLPIRNDTVSIAEPGKSFGGIGGGFSTLKITVALPQGTLQEGSNTLRFRFHHTDGFVSGFRVLAFNLLDASGNKILSPETFAEDAPEEWNPPLPDAASIEAGRRLWDSAALRSSSLPNSTKILARCADCHARDGRDLKYFNFSNHSIITRSRFHGLSELQGEQIASYIRSLKTPAPGRPWNPPYQPGPGLDAQPVANWAAGAGLDWVLDLDTGALPYLLAQRAGTNQASASPASSPDLLALAAQVAPEIFRPDGNLNPREIPIALQLPDWSGWLPRVHPKDAWGPAFADSDFAALYDGGPSGKRTALRTLLAGRHSGKSGAAAISAAFAQWAEARQVFLKPYAKADAAWTPALTNNVYSTQLWQLVKTWEMMQDFGLESRGADFFGPLAEPRTWFTTVLAETSPDNVRIPDGPAGVGGSALTNEYFTSSWYELQILLNSGNHQHRERGPLDWVYIIGHYHDLYRQSHQPEPVRLLVAVAKALQSTDPRIGPDDLKRGWRPEDNVDPRIMIDPVWAPFFQPLPSELHRALTTALLSAWMDKNLQYPVSRYLPFGLQRKPYAVPYGYGEITGGQAWNAVQQFKAAGVSQELVARLREWGLSYNERAARLQYDQSSSRKR
jgi:cytochrome c553